MACTSYSLFNEDEGKFDFKQGVVLLGSVVVIVLICFSWNLTGDGIFLLADKPYSIKYDKPLSSRSSLSLAFGRRLQSTPDREMFSDQATDVVTMPRVHRMPREMARIRTSQNLSYPAFPPGVVANATRRS